MARAFGLRNGPSDAALERSTPAVTNAFIEGIYSKLSPVYDALFGAVLQPGRIAAVSQMGNAAGTRVLEVGIGTGLGAQLYPSCFEVTGIDLCPRMLDHARKRIAREELHHITLQRMDAACLDLDADSFDIVYAPYTISVVPDPVQVAREMRRVCRPGGRVMILNHFRSSGRVAAALERIVSPVTMRLGFRSDLDLSTLLASAQLELSSSTKVNLPPIWTLVTCLKDGYLPRRTETDAIR